MIASKALLTIEGWVRSWNGTEKDYLKHNRKIHSWVNGVEFLVSKGAEPIFRELPAFCHRNEYTKGRRA